MMTNGEAITLNGETYVKHDLSSEKWRRYDFVGGGMVYIDNPQYLLLRVEASSPAQGGGAHRVYDTMGISHYIPRGWIHLHWAVKDATKQPFDF